MTDNLKPRAGLPGAFDRFFGPGATRIELGLSIGIGLLAGAAMVIYAVARGLGWDTAQLALAGFFAADLTGGSVANATSAAKRWYHRKGQSVKELFGFVAMHGVYPFLVTWFFRSGEWAFFIIIYGYLLLAAAIILRVELYLQRPIAFLMFCGALLINAYLFPPTPGLEWFVPLLFLKLILSHIVREEPYSPDAPPNKRGDR